MSDIRDARRGVRPPRGRAAPPGVGGRRLGPARAAPRPPASRGCSASPSPRRSAAGAATLLDSVDLQEAMFEAGASSGLMAALFTGGIALPAHREPSGQRRPGRPVRPARPWPARRSASLAVTEPGGGSDVAGIRTTAVREGDHYVVNGAKTFITSGVRADFVTTAVRTGGPGHGGVEPARRRGRARPASPSTGRCARWAGTAPTPPSCRTSTCGSRPPTWSARRTRGFYQIAEQFVVERIGARRARLRHRRPLARADRGVLPRPRDVRQAADRQPGGAAQARRDAPAGRGGPHLHPRGRRAGTSPGENVIAEACLAKQTACDAATYVCDQAVQLHGGTGYMHGTEVERHYRDARILPIGGGATEVLTDLAADCWGTRHDRPADERVPTAERRGVAAHGRAAREGVGAGQRRHPDRRVLAGDVRGAVDPRLDRARGRRVVQGPREAQRRRADVLVALPGHPVRAERGLRVRGRHRRRDRSTTGATGSSPTAPAPKVTEYFRLEPALPLRLYWLLLGHAARPHQREGHAHHAGADEGGGRA